MDNTEKYREKVKDEVIQEFCESENGEYGFLGAGLPFYLFL